MEKNPLTIIPKKNNIDLKKHLSKKLEKLNRRTELAIMELIKDNYKKTSENNIDNKINQN